jgi:tripartite-type tricarboxylate transporter receptor subunit TctC
MASLAVVVALATTAPAHPQGGPQPSPQSSSQALSKSWPQRPVRIVVPFATGGSSDDIARLVATHLSGAFGQQFIVESRPGGAGAVAAEIVARAPADGHTLLLASVPLIAILPATVKTSFNPVRDFAPISVIATNPLVLAANRGLPVHSVADLVGYARDRPGQLTYAAAGVGTITHLTMTMLAKRAGIAMTPVMYRGGSANLSDVIAGRVAAGFSNISTILPLTDGNLLRPLAVTSVQRAPRLPDVPTLAESGYPDFHVLNWTGLMAPAATPKDIVGRIAREVARAAKDPKVAALMIAHGATPVGNTPNEFAAMIAADVPAWAEAVKRAGLGER